MTVSGGTVGVKCVFPFKYQGKEYKVYGAIKKFSVFKAKLVCRYYGKATKFDEISKFCLTLFCGLLRIYELCRA